MTLRPATLEDCSPVYQWRNAPETRRYSQHPEPVSWEDHSQWFQSSLEREDRTLLIGESDNQPVGVIRYDFTPDRSEVEVSIYVLPEHHGQGHGARLLCAGSRYIRQRFPSVQVIRAEILSDNVASHKAFLKAGFKEHSRLYRYRL